MASRPKSSYRNIKRIQTSENDETKNTQTYTFFQKIISDNILLLKDEKEKLNYSSWLERLNNEEKNSKILHLIKILLVSIKNNHVYFIFTQPPSKDLSDLNFEADHTVDMIEYLRVNTLEENKHKFVHMSKSKRSAAVNPDMLSYSLSKTSHYIVQSFYAMSDYPIYTWYNPAAIEVPNNIDHNQWELYLTRFNLLSQNKNRNQNQEGNTCEDIMKLDQVSKEVASKFNWHPYSILFTSSRPKLSAAFYDTDLYVLTQPVIQQQIDEAAFAIVHNKSFPSFKALNQKALYDQLMPDPNHVFKMTGVRITYNSISPSTFKSCTRRWVRAQEDPDAVCGRNAAAGRSDKNGDGKKQSCHAARPAESARPTCKRVTTLDVTEFRSAPADSCPSRRSDARGSTDDGCRRACANPSSDATGCRTRESDARGSTGSNDGGCRTWEKCRDTSSNDVTDYDWTRFSDEVLSADRGWRPDSDGTRDNPANGCGGNERSYACRKDDRLAGASSTGQDRRKADAGAVDRSCSRRSRGGRAAVNASSNAIGCGPGRANNRTTVSPIRELTETETTGSNDSGCRTREKCSDPPNRDASSDDVTDYDWTRFSDEVLSADREWKPSFNSTRKSSAGNDGKSLACRKDDRLAGTSTGQNLRKADACAVDRPCSRRPLGRVGVDASSSNAVGHGSRKVTGATASPAPAESAETDENPRARAARSDDCSNKSQWSNEVDFKQSRKFGGRPVDYHHVIENDFRDGYIEDVSMPHISFDSLEESSASKSFPECESRDRIEDVSMPRIDYESTFSSDG